MKDLQNFFFNPNNSKQRVALENNVLRQRCQSILEDLFRSQDVTEATMQQIFQVSKNILICNNETTKHIKIANYSSNC